LRLMKQCETFVHSRKMVADKSDFFCVNPHPQAAEYLAAWIMNTCDEINLDGTPKDPSVERASYTHAQKMRAAATFGFGRMHNLGMLAWHRSEITGSMLGNPSVSETLSSYMLSLRRRKVSNSGVSSSHFNVIFHIDHCLDIKPFVLYEMPPELAHLCAVRAYSRWVHFGGVQEGYLFRKIRVNDRIAED
ncbi:hypothetical protein BDP27DRAFT_1204947, partial [Rhodocollybia butyracea]